MGALICGLVCIITTFVPCEDTIISFDEMVKIYSGGHYDEMRNLLITTKNVIQTLDMLREE